MDASSISCCFLAFVLYYNSLDAGFVYDDSRAILSNPDVLPTTPISDLWHNDFWGTPLTNSGSHGSYRPLCVFSFRLNHWACGFRPWGYHLVNVLLHLLSTSLVVRVAKIVLPSSGPTMAGLIFAAHPIHTEAVSGIVGRADMLACVFYLLSFIFYTTHIKHRDKHYIQGHCYSNMKRSVSFLPVKSRLLNCCENQCHTRRYRLRDVLQMLFGVLKLGSCPSGLQDLPPCFMSCFSIQQWACLFTSVIMAAAAMLSKETGVTVLAVCAVYDVIRSRRVPVKTLRLATSLCVLGLSLVCLMLLRIHIMGPNTPAFASSDNPTARSPSFLVRTITFLYLPIFNMQLLICPKVLSFDWSMDAIPRITSVFDPRVPLTIVVYYLTYRSVRHALVGVFSKSIRREGEKQPCYRRTLARTTQQYNNFRNANVNNNNNNNNNSIVHIKFASKVCLSCRHSVSDNHSQQCRIVNNNNHTVKCECHIVRTNRSAEKSEIFLISLSLLVIPFLPATNLLFYVGFVVAERVLYIPSVGYSFLLAYGCHLLSKRTSKRGVRVCLALLLAVFTARTLQRNKDWMDEESLYRSGIPVNPPKAYGNLGSVLSTQGRMAEAEQAYRMALKYRPNMADVHYNLGILLQGREEYDEAIVSYQLAIQCRPSLALAHLNLGQLLASRGRCEEAEAVLRRCSQLDGTGLKDPRTHENTRISALLHLGRLHADRGKYQEAVNVYKEAIQAMPQHYQPQILYNLLGEALSRLHMHDEAEHWYKAALLAKPDHVPAHLTYGKLLAKNRTRLVEAEQWFLRAQKLAPSDPMVYQHFGQFLSELERYNEAATQYLKAVKLAPKQYEVVLGAATALRQAGRKTEAEAFYREAVKLRPDDSGSHSNLGAMLHLNGKFTEAAASYREALRLQPHDVTTINNLHKLHNLMARVRT